MTVTRRMLLAGFGAGLFAGRALGQVAGVALPATQIPALGFDAEPSIAFAKLGGDVGFAVLDAQSGEVVSHRHEARPMAPASTLKIVTALYALDRLGAQHRFATRVIRDGDRLILAGGGDPLLDTDDLAALAARTIAAWQGPAPTSFEIWGGALPQMGRLSQSQDEHLPYNPSLSGMILNFNRVHLGWRQGQMSLEARGSGLSPRAYTVSIRAVDRSLPLFTYETTEKKEAWTIARRSMGKSGSRWLPVRRPELYAGDVFQTLCRAKGLVLPTPRLSTLTPTGIELARLESAPLTEIVDGMLKYSNNLTAEVIGLAASGKSDPEGSAHAMAEWLGQILPGDEFAFHDHSGLSAQNRVTAMTLARLLALESARRDLPGLLKPIPLRDAKGRKRESPIEILAKTGTLNFVSNLAGYARFADGRTLAFAILSGDEARRAATEGQELPDGVSTWTRRSKEMQQALIEGWMGALPERVAAPAGATGTLR
ncbi:D-alanyl-D-alanine carboxypeptidase/D-alanyl-D-alanine-endopeptidase [Paracoccus ravus]|uniref:D-alanyl-D-alanine carboxypeptidase/D-alanyl-D-alanine-endopeptidase n=1 Tax=Paracoccus ravus TaxID=2447760 RepID=UPI00106E9B40|nr:D-alanyl-D-alanine carboxypeptidase [Paracoccus ravus]